MNKPILCALILSLAPYAAARGHAPNAPPAPDDATAGGRRVFLRVLPGAEGGFYAVWNSSNPAGRPALYAQRFSLDGSPVWTGSGAQLVSGLAHAGDWDAASDGNGGLIAASVDGARLRLRRFGRAGFLTWESPLPEMVDTPVSSIVLTEDGAGGVYGAWEQASTEGSTIWVQRWNADGQALWPAPGLRPSDAEARQTRPVLVRDGQGGVIVGWKSFVQGNSKARLQRLSGDGKLLWQAHGVDVESPAGDLRQRLIVAAPGSGGAVVAWTQGVDGKNRIFFQHVEPQGHRDWSVAGVTPGVPLDEEWNPVLVGGDDGVWIGWEDVADGQDTKVKLVRRTKPKGDPWPAGVIFLAQAPGSQGRLDLALDGAGGIFAVWMDNRTSTGLYLQHVNAQGETLLADGQVLALHLTRPQYPHLVVLPENHIAVAWLEEQAGERWALRSTVVTARR